MACLLAVQTSFLKTHFDWSNDEIEEEIIHQSGKVYTEPHIRADVLKVCCGMLTYVLL